MAKGALCEGVKASALENVGQKGGCTLKGECTTAPGVEEDKGGIFGGRGTPERVQFFMVCYLPSYSRKNQNHLFVRCYHFIFLLD
ncbi:hypothetical protein H6P81_017890 [Aristolochia fimbriata]|uniref:Uncharacterized protein n=1 Tax=Aristolochia fimbriata TaxID=158543 RepID=A0AAV7E2K3_ARIFI|nr:hypothetical protein H6P81_017890 [Aristolochia fimbriata]